MGYDADVFAVVDVDVGPADAACHDFHQDLVRAHDPRRLHLPNADGKRLFDDRGCHDPVFHMPSLQAHPFTAPMVSPFTSDRWASQPRTIGGRTTRVEMAHSLAQKRPCWVMKLAMYTGTGAACT